MPMPRSTEDDFWGKSKRDGECLRWIASVGSTGYGNHSVGGVHMTAHRHAYELVNGRIPAGAHVRHTCDNRWCVEPKHLVLGSHQDNMNDRHERGRTARGERGGRVKLTESQVLHILRSPLRNQELADQYAVHKATISHIRTGRNWSHLNDQKGTK